MNLLTSGATRLREAERAAKAAKKGMWINYVAPPSAHAKASDHFTGAWIEYGLRLCSHFPGKVSGRR